ncbi:hypothetical protein IW140_006082 [Coemansia sp. RSA 1813]|nr:hypothetical protein EV178_006035 [Coemansia sp. RSA 1646]KAJ1772968.1 hypothetical protein LPJ74_001109 [Coemansia sp. RSA 1843]KAJ2093545.1 hypothetical protein IW138_000398 [Coemansia sp. RSA 986]KAJ2210732.1 hypothetical protein EV179_006023 [Coemansia sp. RSA 487]KAJ2563524.1 hypothetical protein IW140_006082 [Coemansia sp. RSA 1813]
MTDQLADNDGLQNVFCPDKTCTSERDWIVEELAPGVLLPLGSACLVAGIISIALYRHMGSLMYEKNGISLSMLVLGIGIILRAAVGLDTTHKEALYIASMVLNYHAGQCIYNALFVNSFCINTPWEHTKKGRINIAVGTNQTLGLFAVTVCGAVLMFHPTTNARAGMNCFRVVFVIMMSMTLAMIGIFAYRIKMLHRHMAMKNVISSALVFGLFGIWCTYMLARTFVGLESPARSCPDMLVWFDYIPLCFCFIVAKALGEPLAFDSEDAQPVLACQDVELAGLEHGIGVAEYGRASDSLVAISK